MPFVDIHNHSLTFRLRRSAKAKRLQLIARADFFEIVAPLRVSNQDALRFLWDHRPWMLKQHRRKQVKASNPVIVWPENFLAQEMIPYRGEKLRLQVKFAGQAQTVLASHALIFTLAWHKTAAFSCEPTVKKALMHWYQQQAAQLVQQTLDDYCPRLGRWPNGFQLKWQKTRWGSCGINQKIYINWLLVLAPPGVLEYVVIHELCHLFHRNHGQRFWDKVGSCMPDYARYDKWLSQHGHGLRPTP